jgi:hypothetical protein
MRLSIFLIPLVALILFLLGFILTKIISGLLLDKKIKPIYWQLLPVALVGIWLLVSLYLLIIAALGHSETAKSLFKWKSLLAFGLIVGAPLLSLFLLRIRLSKQFGTGHKPSFHLPGVL